MQVMESANPEVQRIFKESMHVFVLALTFNSLFVFILAALCLLVGTALHKGLRHVKELAWQRAQADTRFAFFSPELATV